jgi:hypothetical protein
MVNAPSPSLSAIANARTRMSLAEVRLAPLRLVAGSARCLLIDGGLTRLRWPCAAGLRAADVPQPCSVGQTSHDHSNTSERLFVRR